MIIDTSKKPRPFLSERFAWNGMWPMQGLLELQKRGKSLFFKLWMKYAGWKVLTIIIQISMHVIPRAFNTLFAMLGIRLDLYQHKSYFIPALLIFFLGQYYQHWFVTTTVFDDEQKARIVFFQAAAFPWVYYFFLCTFPYWTNYLRQYVGSRMVIVIFNLGMGALWVFNVALFHLLYKYDSLTNIFNDVPEEVMLFIGSIMMVFGWIVKFWASYILGVASYFYADMIHRQPLEGATFTMVGPYKYFRNPMYGIGYIGAYGFGLVHRSPLCLCLAGVMHMGVWFFNFNVEQVWVDRIYGAKDDDAKDLKSESTKDK